MNQDELLSNVLVRLKQKRGTMVKACHAARRAAIDADGPMQSRYDTAKKERSWLADSHAARIRSIDETISILKEALREPGRGGIGAVRVRFEGEKETSVCLLLPEGVSTELDEEGIIPVSLPSPLGRAISGTAPGQTAEVKIPAGMRIFTVLEGAP